MDKLLHSLSEEKAGVSICNLYLGGAARADDVRTVATSVEAAEEQGAQILKFTSNYGLSTGQKLKLSSSQLTPHHVTNPSTWWSYPFLSIHKQSVWDISGIDPSLPNLP